MLPYPIPLHCACIPSTYLSWFERPMPSPVTAYPTCLVADLCSMCLGSSPTCITTLPAPSLPVVHCEKGIVIPHLQGTAFLLLLPPLLLGLWFRFTPALLPCLYYYHSPTVLGRCTRLSRFAFFQCHFPLWPFMGTCLPHLPPPARTGQTDRQKTLRGTGHGRMEGQETCLLPACWFVASFAMPACQFPTPFTFTCLPLLMAKTCCFCMVGFSLYATILVSTTTTTVLPLRTYHALFCSFVCDRRTSYNLLIVV